MHDKALVDNSGNIDVTGQIFNEATFGNNDVFVWFMVPETTPLSLPSDSTPSSKSTPPQSSKKANARISMLSRGGALGGVVGSSNEV